MSFMETLAWPYAVSGFLVGLLVGLTGVGGGALTTPLLVLAFGVAPSTAVGTDLIFLFVTKSVGVAVHGLRGGVDWPVVGKLSLGSLSATLVISALIWYSASHGTSGNGAIRTVLGITLLLTAAATIFRRQVLTVLQPAMSVLSSRQKLAVTLILGIAIGALVSFTSIGAGAIGITVLLLVYPDISAQKLVGSDIAHAVPLTLVAGLFHWAGGRVDASILVSLLLGSVPAIIISSALAERASGTVLRPLIAFALTLAGLKLVV